MSLLTLLQSVVSVSPTKLSTHSSTWISIGNSASRVFLTFMCADS
jgi:hypothetical protein